MHCDGIVPVKSATTETASFWWSTESMDSWKNNI